MNGDDVKYFNKKFDSFEKWIKELSGKIDRNNEKIIEERTENKVRWEEHATRSELRNQQFNQVVSDLKAEDKLQNQKIDIMPCGKHAEAMKSLADKIKNVSDTGWRHVRTIYIFLGATITVFGFIMNTLAK